jgi:predicted Zn-ribbon and HTH transcriptional regulator
VAMPFTLKRILRQKKNYGNSNISPCKNIIFKKSSKRNQNPSRCYNCKTNLKFQHKPKYHLSKILISKQTYYLEAKTP